jgi:hypothetical protein
MNKQIARRLSRRTIILLLLAVGAVGAGPVLTWHQSRAKRPNLLLITLDTIRADRLGCYGYQPARAPALDALAASGVVCQRVRTVAPITIPAHVSLFTGLYPERHGQMSSGILILFLAQKQCTERVVTVGRTGVELDRPGQMLLGLVDLAQVGQLQLRPGFDAAAKLLEDTRRGLRR